jgi:hypothetical protein
MGSPVLGSSNLPIIGEKDTTQNEFKKQDLKFYL